MRITDKLFTMKNKIYFFILIIIIASCKKIEPAQVPADVYISGYLLYDNDSDINAQAVYWKNNQLVMLQNNGKPSYANDVFVAGNDIYVAGFLSYGRTNAPVYWKNGILNMLPLQNPSAIKSGVATKIMLVNNMVYVVGTEYYGGNYVIKIWKNGVGTNITSEDNDAFLSDMDISNSNVYLVGYEKQSNVALNVYSNYWTNNTAQRIGNNTSIIYGIKVIGNDIYTVGTINNSTVCRINGVAQTYFTNALMNDIYVANNTRYIAGVSQNKAVCWLNDSLINLSNPFLAESSADAIAVNGPDVYIVGYEKIASGMKKARYWLNTQSLTLNDSSSLESIANAIYIVKQ